MTKRLSLRGAAIAAGALVSGCVSVTPDEALQTVDLPTSWTALSDAESGGVRPVTDNWLSDLNDTQITALVAEAIHYNSDLAVSAAQVRATRESVGIARAGLLPSLSGTLRGQSARFPGQTFVDPDFGVAVQRPESSSDTYNLGFSLSWELDMWGRITDGVRADYLGAAASRLDYASAELSLAGGTAQAFYSLTEARLQRRLSERDVDTGEANLRIIERRYNRGISSSLDVRLARSSLAQSRATLIGRQRTELEASRRLEVLLGRYPAAELMAADALPTLRPFAETSGWGDPESLLYRRPDVLAAEQRLQAAGLDASAARKALLPTLSISASAFEEEQSSSNISFDPSDAVQSLTANLIQPLFQGGRLRAQARAARATMEASIHTYVGTVLSASEEVENAIAAERFLSAQEDAQREAFEEARASEELTNRQYLNGTANIFDLITAQQRRTSAESAFIAASRARLSNRINLYLALGAPFDAPAPVRANDGAPIPVERRPGEGLRLGDLL